MIARATRFLILRGGAIGDFIVTLPALQMIRDRWPEAYIELIGYPHVARLALQNGLVNEVRSLDQAGIAAFFGRKPSFSAEQVEHIRSFDLIFTWLHDLNGAVQDNLLLAGARHVVYGSPLIPDGVPAVEHLVRPLESLALYTQQPCPRLVLDADVRAAGQKVVQQRVGRQRAWAIHPSSGSPRKNWPLRHFRELADRLTRDRDVVPLYILGEADASIQEELSRDVPPKQLVTGQSLTELAALLSACDGYVGNDSGITHLAAAVMQRPVIALFGPSDARQWAPRGAAVNLLQAESGDLADLSPDHVWATLQAALSPDRLPPHNENQ